MALKINTKYPSIDDLRAKARKKIPKFAFEYLDGGCNEDVNLHRNTSELKAIQKNQKTRPTCLQRTSVHSGRR